MLLLSPRLVYPVTKGRVKIKYVEKSSRHTTRRYNSNDHFPRHYFPVRVCTRVWRDMDHTRLSCLDCCPLEVCTTEESFYTRVRIWRIEGECSYLTLELVDGIGSQGFWNPHGNLFLLISSFYNYIILSSLFSQYRYVLPTKLRPNSSKNPYSKTPSFTLSLKMSTFYHLRSDSLLSCKRSLQLTDHSHPKHTSGPDRPSPDDQIPCHGSPQTTRTSGEFYHHRLLESDTRPDGRTVVRSTGPIRNRKPSAMWPRWTHPPLRPWNGSKTPLVLKWKVRGGVIPDLYRGLVEFPEK